MKFIIYMLTKQWQVGSKCSEQLRISILCKLCSKQLRASSEYSECFESSVKIWADCQLADVDSLMRYLIYTSAWLWEFFCMLSLFCEDTDFENTSVTLWVTLSMKHHYLTCFISVNYKV